MKKKTLLIITAMIVIIACIGGSVAYFNSQDTADNVFTVGDVKIELTEPAWDPNEEHIIAPGRSFDKDPQVKNTGDNDAWVRVHVSFPNGEAVADAFGLTSADALDSLYKAGIDTDKWISAAPVIEGGTTTFTYMYKDILPAEVSTGALFSKVTIPETTDMDAVLVLPGDGLEINISADAIQAKGFENAEEAFVAFDQN